MIGYHKTLSVGKVKSYGSNTCIQSSVGQGAQGSPVFNELGRCWGILIGSHDDIPSKVTAEETSGQTLSSTIVKSAAKDSKRKRSKKDKKKDSKKRKKDKKIKKAENRPSAESLELPESQKSEDELLPLEMAMDISNDSESEKDDEFELKKRHSLC